MKLNIPVNSIVIQNNTYALKAADEYKKQILEEPVTVFKLITNEYDIIYLLEHTDVKLADGTIKKIEDVRPNDKLIKIKYNLSDTEGINNKFVPELLGLTLMPKMNGTSLFAALKQQQEHFKNILDEASPLFIKLLDEEYRNSIGNRVNAFYRFCGILSHGIPDIVDRFNREELLIFISTLLKTYGIDTTNGECILNVDKDLTAAEYLSSVFRKVGLFAYVTINRTQHGDLYKIIISGEHLNDILMNSYLETLNEKQITKYEVFVTSLVIMEPVRFTYLISDDSIYINNILINESLAEEL